MPVEQKLTESTRRRPSSEFKTEQANSVSAPKVRLSGCHVASSMLGGVGGIIPAEGW